MADQEKGTASLWDALPCGCRATACDNGAYRIEAEAFLCQRGHKQGTVVVFDDIDHNAECIREALRMLGRFDPLDEYGTARAASEALGFFVYKARKEASE